MKNKMVAIITSKLLPYTYCMFTLINTHLKIVIF